MKHPAMQTNESDIVSAPWHVEDPELAAQVAEELGKEKEEIEADGGVMSLPGWVAGFGIEP